MLACKGLCLLACTEASCLLARGRQGRKSGGQGGRWTGCFEEADPDRDHWAEAGEDMYPSISLAGLE